MEKTDLAADKKLTYIDTDRETGLCVYRYRPTLFRPEYCLLHRTRLKRQLRLLFEYLHKGHYVFYYAVLDDKIIGYNMVAPGGRRLGGTTAQDGVTGPSYILPAYRNRGYNRAMKRIVFRDCGFRRIYCWVHKDNQPSIASLKRLGFEPCGEVMEKKGLFRKQIVAENGDSIVFRYDVPEDGR